MKYKIGDKVKTRYGISEVLYFDIEIDIYLVGIKGFDGHDGNSILTKKEIQKYVIDKGYENQCWCFCESSLELIEENQK